MRVNENEVVAMVVAVLGGFHCRDCGGKFLLVNSLEPTKAKTVPVLKKLIISATCKQILEQGQVRRLPWVVVRWCDIVVGGKRLRLEDFVSNQK